MNPYAIRPNGGLKVSVALCTCNGERFLAEQLQSLFSQTSAVDEIIVCDDASTDRTLAIVNRFIDEHPGIIALYVNDQRLKPVKNFEKAIRLCSGDVIFLSDQDDVWLPRKVEVMMECLSENPSALLLFTNGDLINESGKRLDGTLWEHWGFDLATRTLWLDNDYAFRSLLRGVNKITGATVAFRSVLKESIFPFEMSDRYWHDAWLSLFAAKCNGLRFMDLSLINYRIHSRQLVGVGNGIRMRHGGFQDQGSVPTLRRAIKKWLRL
jgi:glycosyltransferase involved in cell wall biosynthesis